MLCSRETGKSADSRRPSCSNYSGERARLGLGLGTTWLPMRSLGPSVSRMRQLPARGRAERGSFWWGTQIGGKQNGIPDCIGCGGDDGAVYVNHCAMLKSAGMAITFTAILRGLLPRHACHGRQKLFAFSRRRTRRTGNGIYCRDQNSPTGC